MFAEMRLGEVLWWGASRGERQTAPNNAGGSCSAWITPALLSPAVAMTPPVTVNGDNVLEGEGKKATGALVREHGLA
jgi:hypothetical protein